MESTTPPSITPQPPVDAVEAVLTRLDRLFTLLQQLSDSRGRKGRRYPLSWLLLLIVLAKLSGQDKPLAIADWVSGRRELLRHALSLPWPRMPHHNTYRRILERVVKPEELELLVSQFLQELPTAGASPLLAIDGKTLRGTCCPKHPQGEHLLTAYLPQEGIVLNQKSASEKGNEISLGPSLLGEVDLRKKIVAGDALHTQRGLSEQILDGGGDYVWVAKGNQPRLQGDIEYLFAPNQSTVLGGVVPVDFEVYRTVEKGHGRLEEREITTSSLLEDYCDWPGLKQVYRVRRQRTELRSGERAVQVVYGLTSLKREEAAACRLLQLTRQYWGIENGLFGRRDVTFQEDKCRLTVGQAGRVMASLNNLVIGLFRQAGYHNLAQARRQFDAFLTCYPYLTHACLIT